MVSRSLDDKRHKTVRLPKELTNLALNVREDTIAF